MLGRILPLPELGEIIASEYPRGKVFKQLLESGAPGAAGTYGVNALNIAFTLSCIPGVFLNVDTEYRSATKSIEALKKQIELTEKANTVIAAQIVFLEAAIVNAENYKTDAQSQVTEMEHLYAEGGSTKRLFLEYLERVGTLRVAESAVTEAKQSLEAAKVQKESNLGAIEGYKHQQEIVTNERQLLGSTAAAIMFHDFMPLNITARLVHSQARETAWVGTIPLTVIPSGALVNEITEIGGFFYRVYVYEVTYVTTETHESVPPFTLEQMDPILELELTITGPTEWEIGKEKSGCGFLRTGIKEGKSEGVKWFGQGKKKQAEKKEEANLVTINSSNLSVNYTHEP